MKQPQYVQTLRLHGKCLAGNGTVIVGRAMRG